MSDYSLHSRTDNHYSFDYASRSNFGWKNHFRNGKKDSFEDEYKSENLGEVRIDKLDIIDSLVKASQNGVIVKIICPVPVYF